MKSRSKKERSRVQEIKLVDDLQALGFAAERIRDQSARRVANGDAGGDVSVPLMGIDYRIECKHQSRFGPVYETLKNAPIGMIQGVGRGGVKKKRLFVLDEDMFFKLIQHWEATRCRCAPPVDPSVQVIEFKDAAE
jgi:hypothetical protein